MSTEIEKPDAVDEITRLRASLTKAEAECAVMREALANAVKELRHWCAYEDADDVLRNSSPSVENLIKVVKAARDINRVIETAIANSDWSILPESFAKLNDAIRAYDATEAGK